MQIRLFLKKERPFVSQEKLNSYVQSLYYTWNEVGNKIV
jgi:hypothetical protein